MTVAGWIEIALFVVRPHRAHAAARRLHGARLPRRGCCSTASLGPVERGFYRAAAASTRERGQDWKAYAALRARLQRRLLRAALPDPAHQGIHPFNPQDLALRPLRRHVQHRRVVHHQHELAVLRGRDDAVELPADGRPGRPELRLGRRRHRRRDRRSSAASPPARARARQLLRRPHQGAPLRPAADLRSWSASCSSPRASSSR